MGGGTLPVRGCVAVRACCSLSCGISRGWHQPYYCCVVCVPTTGCYYILPLIRAEQQEQGAPTRPAYSR